MAGPPGDDDDDDDPRALVPAAPVPPLRLARDLQSAHADELVYLDPQGDVQAPAKVRARRIVRGVVRGVALGSAGAFYWIYFGPASVAVLGALVGLGAWPRFQLRRINLAVRLFAANRLDEDQALLERVGQGALVHKRVRALAHLNLAAIASRRGELARALEHARAAADGLPAHTLQGAMVRYAEVATLVELGRPAEARAVLLAVTGAAPDGEFLRTARWEAELHLMFAEDALTLDADALHERVRAALRLSTGGSLLALLAWAHHRLGDLELAWFLLREALTREDLALSVRSLPGVHAWIAAHEAAARAAAPPDDD